MEIGNTARIRIEALEACIGGNRARIRIEKHASLLMSREPLSCTRPACALPGDALLFGAPVP